MRMYLTSRIRAAVSIYYDGKALFGMDGGLFSIDESQIKSVLESKQRSVSMMILIIPITSSGRKPISTELELKLRDEGRIGISSSDRCVRILDWSGSEATEAETIIEIIPYFDTADRQLPPMLLDSIETDAIDFISINGNPVSSIGLYRDDGIRLIACSNEVEKGFYICDGESGALKTIDAGFGRFLVIHVCGCKGHNGRDLSESGERFERLIVLDADLKQIGVVCGSCCTVEDGCLIAVDELETVLGHQRRLKYELFSDGLKAAQEYSTEMDLEPEQGDPIGEIGFFTHMQTAPENEANASLALLECILLGRRDEAMSLLAPELRKNLDFDSLCDFFGDFDEARVAPFNEEMRICAVGAVKNDSASVYSFEFKNGSINDVSELEPPFLPRLTATSKAAKA